MQSKVPLYPYSAKDAMKRGEIEKWRESFRENCACAGGIDILIRENFDGMHLKDGTVLQYALCRFRVCKAAWHKGFCPSICPCWRAFSASFCRGNRDTL